ncbi:uncharacterized protein [Argopecten irradians]|uniref:uncharacterized protein n=1 Tax=Argopecten irradians TaxID=31199 RepID=UPI003711D2C1
MRTNMAGVSRKPRTDLFEAFPDTLRRRLKAIIRHFLDSSFAGPKLDPNLPSIAALRIINCNATGKSVPFYQATCDVERHANIFPFYVIFKTGFKILRQFLITGSAPVEQDHRHTLAKLLNFIMAIEKESPLHHLENCADEVSLNVLLTNHLFAMLCSSSQFTMDNHLYRKHDRYMCPCGSDECELTGKCGDTSIGNTNVWHGNLDVILNSNLPVKFTSLGDGDYTNSDDETKNKSPVNNCANLNRKASLKLNQQMIAEVIVFSFLNKKLHPCSESYLVPCLGSCGTDLVVYLYDAQHDVLLESCQFELRNKTTGALNLVTIIVTWLVVNYRYTCTGLTPYMMKKSNFFTSAKEKLQVYQEDLKFGCVGLSEAEVVVEVSDLPWNADGLKDIDDELDELSKYF